MNTVKYRALAKDGTWRYGLYPCLNVDMGNTKYPMDVFWNSFLSTLRRETLGQWAGLLDKQGKEIYEGDIISSSSFNRYEVVFRDGAFAEIHYPDDGWIHWLKDAKEIRGDRDFIFGKVIGNIYENRDLLEAKR